MGPLSFGRGALIGLAAASPEIGINTISAVRGVLGIGLEAMIGANIIALPPVMLLRRLLTQAIRPRM